MKYVFSEKNSLYYQENIDFIRENQSQYYLEKERICPETNEWI